MKAFLWRRGKKDYEEVRKIGHHLGKLREACAKLDAHFEDADLIVFCQNYSGTEEKDTVRGNEVFKYGLGRQALSHGINLEKLVPLVDRIFLGTFTHLDDMGFEAFGTHISSLFCKTIHTAFLAKFYSEEQLSVLRTSIQQQNTSLESFLDTAKRFQNSLQITSTDASQ